MVACEWRVAATRCAAATQWVIGHRRDTSGRAGAAAHAGRALGLAGHELPRQGVPVAVRVHGEVDLGEPLHKGQPGRWRGDGPRPLHDR